LLITYKALNGLPPLYLSKLLTHYSPSRLLSSHNFSQLIIPRISKSTAGLDPYIVQEADTLCQFKSRLKRHLLGLAYTLLTIDFFN